MTAKIYSLKDLLEGSFEEALYRRCQEVVLLKPWACFLAIYPSLADPTYVLSAQLIRASVDEIAAWMQSLDNMIALQEMVTSEYDYRATNRRVRDYQALLDEIGRTHVFQSEGVDVQNGYEHVDIHAMRRGEDGKLQHCYWLSLSRPVTHAAMLETFGYAPLHKTSDPNFKWDSSPSARDFMNYIQRESKCGSELDAEKVKAWMATLPPYLYGE